MHFVPMRIRKGPLGRQTLAAASSEVSCDLPEELPSDALAASCSVAREARSKAPACFRCKRRCRALRSQRQARLAGCAARLAAGCTVTAGCAASCTRAAKKQRSRRILPAAKWAIQPCKQDPLCPTDCEPPRKDWKALDTSPKGKRSKIMQGSCFASGDERRRQRSGPARAFGAAA